MKKILGFLIGSSLVRAALSEVSAFAEDKGMVLALPVHLAMVLTGQVQVQFQEFKADQQNTLRKLCYNLRRVNAQQR